MIKIDKKDLDLKATLLSGQCFRVQQINNKFFVVLSDRVILIWEENNYLCIESNNYDNLEKVITNYFDLNTDYGEINKELSLKDKYISSIIEKCKGYKILRQNSFEMYISFIISQNNNVKRISNSVEKISKKYGKKIIFKGNEYCLFPNLDELSNIKISDLNEIGLGYRDKYIINAIEYLKKNKNLFDKLKNLDGKSSVAELMKINGIGLKVASCILLFGFYKLDVFPIDRWVIKNIEIHYHNIKNDVDNISKFAKENYGKYSAIAIQYMFHSERNAK
jgi:N-glycosylase/DNA lyase